MAKLFDGHNTWKASRKKHLFIPYQWLTLIQTARNAYILYYIVWGKDQCRNHDIIPMFTFDQPIWWVARQI